MYLAKTSANLNPRGEQPLTLDHARRCAVCNAEITFDGKYVPNKKYCSKRCHVIRRDHTSTERRQEAYDLYRYMERNMPEILARLVLVARNGKGKLRGQQPRSAE